MATHSAAGVPAVTRSPVRTAALAVSIVFLVVGVAGFIPGVTTNFSDLTFAGPRQSPQVSWVGGARFLLVLNLAMNAVLLAVIAYFLFRRPASAYFRAAPADAAAAAR